MRETFRAVCLIVCCGFATTVVVQGQAKTAEAGGTSAQQLVIIDTDIGDDVDDAYAVGLALQSSELKILGITTAWGNTPLRAQLVERLLQETGRQDIPVAVGIEKYPEKGKLTLFSGTVRSARAAQAVARCGGFLAGRNSKASGRDHTDCDWTGNESGGGDRARCRNVSQTKTDRADGRFGVPRLRRICISDGDTARAAGMEYFVRRGGGKEGVHLGCTAVRDASGLHADPIAGIGARTDFQQRNGADGCVVGADSAVVGHHQFADANNVRCGSRCVRDTAGAVPHETDAIACG